jgi:ribosomal-protein-serine acetyltransferase
MYRRTISPDISIALQTHSHAKELFELSAKNRKILSKIFPHVVESEEEMAQKIKERLLGFAKEESHYQSIFYRDKLVGSINFYTIDRVNKRTNIGYWLDSDHEGKGIMTTVVKDFIQMGINYYDMNKFEIRCSVDNYKSCAIAKRLGFEEEGIIRSYGFINGKKIDLRLYGLVINS